MLHFVACERGFVSMCSCSLEYTHQGVIMCMCMCVCLCAFFYFTSGRFLAVKGFEKCDFELLHVRSQFDQCLLQLSLASGHSEPLINEFLCVSPWTDV